jgi:hypothetical protein
MGNSIKHSVFAEKKRKSTAFFSLSAGNFANTLEKCAEHFLQEPALLAAFEGQDQGFFFV